MVLIEFKEYIKNIRESKNLTIKELSDLSKLSSAQISRLESGTRGTPKPDTIRKLAIGLDVDYNQLMKIAGYTMDEDSTKETQLLLHLSNHPLLTDAILSLTDEELSALTLLLTRK